MIYEGIHWTRATNDGFRWLYGRSSRFDDGSGNFVQVYFARVQRRIGEHGRVNQFFKFTDVCFDNFKSMDEVKDFVKNNKPSLEVKR